MASAMLIGLTVFLMLFSLGNVGMSAYLINKVDSFKDSGTNGDQSKIIKALFGMSITLSLLLTLLVTFGQNVEEKLTKENAKICQLNMTVGSKGIIFFSIGLVMVMTMISYGIYNTNDTIGNEKWTSDQVSNTKKNLGIFLAMNLVMVLFMGGMLYMLFASKKEAKK